MARELITKLFVFLVSIAIITYTTVELTLVLAILNIEEPNLDGRAHKELMPSFKKLICRFEEEVPARKPANGGVWWKQGEFPFGNESRTATVTGVQFLDRDTLIVAHRAAAKLYLVDISKNECNVLKTLSMEKDGLFAHPDVLNVYGNTLYLSHFTNKGAEVDTNGFTFESLSTIDQKSSFHAAYADETGAYFGAAENRNRKHRNNSIFVRDYSGTIKKINLIHHHKFNRRIKSISKFKDLFIVGTDGRIPGADGKALYDSWLSLYKMQGKSARYLHLIDSVVFKNSQIDGTETSGNKVFAAIHSGDDQVGYIVIAEITDNKLNVIRKIEVDKFPHGIDIWKNQRIALSHYSPCTCVVVQELADFRKKL